MATDRLTKSELVDEIAQGANLSKADARRAIAQLQESIINAVAEGKSVTLTRFVSFAPQVREEREWTNPSTGESTTLPEKNLVKVTALASFKDRVAGND